MIDYSIQNKKAWEYNAYDFWVKEAGMPADRAKKIVADPHGALKRYANYFETYKGIRVANICGSCGKKAVPLAVLGLMLRCSIFLRTTNGMRWNCLMIKRQRI